MVLGSLNCSWSRPIIICAVIALVVGLLRPQFDSKAWNTGATFSELLKLKSAKVEIQESSAMALNRWYEPTSWWVNDLHKVVDGSGTHGFVFNGSELPDGVPYGTYNWCNMPHVRAKEYPVANDDYELQYVEVIHRHHKRTPYADNTFPVEAYGWSCSNTGLFYSGSPLPLSEDHPSARTYWNITKDPLNPFTAPGFPGSCAFPQLTHGGLIDAAQHGIDLRSVYVDLLGFLSEDASAGTGGDVNVRVTNNVITSQVASMEVGGLLALSDTDTPLPLNVQPEAIDSLEPTYSCPAAETLYGAYGVGSKKKAWTKHLTASKDLFARLDGISGVERKSTDWHQSWDHYFDNLSARQCHGKPLPCSVDDPTKCVTQAMANEVYRLGQYEYSYIYRDAPQSLKASTGSFGVWITELGAHLRSVMRGEEGPKMRLNVAHDGSVSRLLSVLQIERMMWPGMGSEVVFELYKKKRQSKWYARVLWSGQILKSSHPKLGKLDMLDVDDLLEYFDALVGKKASKVVDYCKA